MTDREQGLLLIAVLLGLSFVFQLQMKMFATEISALLSSISTGQSVSRISQIFLMPRTYLIGVLCILLFVVWLGALTRLELSLALPLASVALVINSIGSGLILGEALTVTRIIGVLAIAAGIVLVLKS